MAQFLQATNGNGVNKRARTHRAEAIGDGGRENSPLGRLRRGLQRRTTADERTFQTFGRPSIWMAGSVVAGLGREGEGQQLRNLGADCARWFRVQLEMRSSIVS